jgi:Fic family protein
MFDPKYSITNSILRNISRIEAVEEVIKHAPILPLWEKQFKEEAIVRAVYHGTHLEGNMLRQDEAKDVLLGKEVIARPRDIQEVINYRKVIQLIDDEASRQIEKITEPLIKKLHRTIVNGILTEEQSGDYRKKQVVIRNSETGEITFRPPPPTALQHFQYSRHLGINVESRQSPLFHFVNVLCR